MTLETEITRDKVEGPWTVQHRLMTCVGGGGGGGGALGTPYDGVNGEAPSWSIWKGREIYHLGLSKDLKGLTDAFNGCESEISGLMIYSC